MPIPGHTLLLGSAGGRPFQYVASTSKIGAGGGGFVSTVPGTVQSGDLVVLILQMGSASFDSQPSGFTEVRTYNYALTNYIRISTGIYNSATHGSSLTWSHVSATQAGICYYVSGADASTNGYVTSASTGNDQFYPTVTAPSGRSFVIEFAYANDQMTDVQLNGFTQREHGTVNAAGTVDAYDQMVSVSGAVTMTRWDSVANEYMLAFYLIPA